VAGGTLTVKLVLVELVLVELVLVELVLVELVSLLLAQVGRLPLERGLVGLVKAPGLARQSKRRGAEYICTTRRTQDMAAQVGK
jgi:hypothetical protein